MAQFPKWKGCPLCGKTQKHTLDFIIHQINTILPSIVIKSNVYINNVTELKCECLVCGEKFTNNWSKLKIGIGCPKCSLDNRSGKNACNWKGGVTPLHNHLRTHILSWKTESFKKYNNKCDITGSTRKKIIHHLHPFSLILKETMDTLNLPIYQEINKYTELELSSIENLCLKLHWKYGLGVCLCKIEHDRFHKIYKYKGDTTKEQYEEYKIMRL